MSCLVCENELSEFINFGRMPIANNFSRVKLGDNQYTFEMRVASCNECGTVQLVDQPDREQMFHENYAFYSSTSTAMDLHFKNLRDKLMSLFDNQGERNALEIGCNDGILLKYLDEVTNALGVEPSRNVAELARSKGLSVENSFFDNVFVNHMKSLDKTFDIVVSANVICHIPYINEIFGGVTELLSNDGVFVHEDPYLVEILQKGTFDQIYDEHVFLFSCTSQSKIARRNGLELFDVEIIPTHGGSARYYFCKPGSRRATSRLLKQFEIEEELDITNISTLKKFTREVEEKRNSFNQLVAELKASGSRIVGYGATSKSTTILNYFGLDGSTIDCIYDTTPTKIGAYTPGTDIPIKDYKEFHKENAEYVILFAWNHKDEIFQKERELFNNTGKKWLTILPNVGII